jgi:hypothetical protein
MRKSMIVLLAVLVATGILTVPQKSAGANPKATALQAAPQEDRVSGTIVRHTRDKSTLIVRENRSKMEKTVVYEASTKWTKGKGQPADMNEFKDGSRVICLGKLNDKGELAATRIDLQ